jgi:hypothetical protein
VATVAKPLIDVNFIENAQMDELPTGYGTYRKEAEIDNLNATLEQCQFDSDLQRQQKRDQESQILAKKVINKYNQNSRRIIESNKIHRTIDIGENEHMMKDIEEKQQKQNNIDTAANGNGSTD